MLVLTDMNMATDTRPRKYRMRKRAESAAETGERIVQATIQLHMERFHDQITLDDIAQRAGVTVQTVLRRFGSKDELIERAADYMSASVLAQRGR
jgi:AcrR family transcriptional regulator